MVCGLDFLNSSDSWRRLAARAYIAHCYGERNLAADAVSRGELDRLFRLCQMLHVRPRPASSCGSTPSCIVSTPPRCKAPSAAPRPPKGCRGHGPTSTSGSHSCARFTSVVLNMGFVRARVTRASAVPMALPMAVSRPDFRPAEYLAALRSVAVHVRPYLDISLLPAGYSTTVRQNPAPSLCFGPCPFARVKALSYARERGLSLCWLSSGWASRRSCSH
jgi:hypothetical protein